jgi:hypothetical protein
MSTLTIAKWYSIIVAVHTLRQWHQSNIYFRCTTEKSLEQKLLYNIINNITFTYDILLHLFTSV